MRCFLKQENAETVSKLGHGHFLQSSLQFLIQHSYHHLNCTMADPDSVVNKLLTPRRNCLRQKSAIYKLFTQFSTFYTLQNVTSLFKTAQEWCLSYARLIQSMFSQPTSSIHWHITVSYKPVSSNSSLLFKINTTMFMVLSHACRMPDSSDPPLFNNVNSQTIINSKVHISNIPCSLFLESALNFLV